MGIARGLARDRAQPEALRGVEGGRLQPAVVEGEAFALAVFQEQLAVIGALQRVVDEACTRPRSMPVWPKKRSWSAMCGVSGGAAVL